VGGLEACGLAVQQPAQIEKSPINITASKYLNAF